MTTAWFDCFSGAAGDMIVAALLDAGASLDRLREDLGGLKIGGYRIEAGKVTKQNFAATRFTVHVDPGEKPHRHLKHILDILIGSTLPEHVKTRASRIFQRLAAAEAEAHGTTVDRVHFHEVGAIDAIVDVVGAVTALDQLGVDRVVCSPICVGSGTVSTEHGILPVPAPGTAILLKDVPLAASDELGELTTPTGAAVLTTLAEGFGPLPALTCRAIGYGAGTRDGVRRPNMLRVILGDAQDTPECDQVVVLEAAIDDSTGEAIGYAVERLFEAGALDVYCVPIYMKKSRPGVLLTVIGTPSAADRLEAMVFSETTTFGVRRTSAGRSKLTREHQTVQTPLGAIRVKTGRRGDRVVTASPEFEDCRRVAVERGLSIRDVMTAALLAWEKARS